MQYSLISATILFFCFVLFLPAKDVISAEWNIVPRLTLSEMYDDNVRLAREGDEEEDYITQLNPGFSIVGKGRYTELLLDYTMQNIFYKENDQFDDTYHSFRASNKTEIVRDNLFLDVSASYSQRIINLQQTSSTDNTAITDNRTDVANYTVKPYYISSFGQSSLLRLEHSHSKTESKDEQAVNTDNTTNTSYLELKNGPTFTHFTWQLSHLKQNVEYKKRSDVESSHSQALFNYLITKKTYLVGVGGYEEYNYAVEEGQIQPKGSYWEGGLGWTPSHRTTLEVRHGEHFYGKTKKFLFNHQTRQSSWSVNYSEQINTTSRIEQQIESELVFNPETETIEELAIVTYSDVAVVSLDKVLSASISKTTVKTVLSLNFSDSYRTYQERTGEERNKMATASWQWQFSRNTSLRLQEQSSENILTTPESEIKTRQHQLSLDRKISANVSASFNYDNTTQRSKSEGILYRRNTFSLSLNARF